MVMIDNVLVLIRQMIQMFLMAGIGYYLFRTEKITAEGSKTITDILIYLVIPVVIVNSFLVERSQDHVVGFLISGIFAVILLILSMLVAHFFFKHDPIASFASAFSNCGFFGIPLIQTVLGQEAVFYLVWYIAILNVFQWTYGVSILNGQPVLQGFQPKKLIRTPFVIAIMLGLLLFVTQFKLPIIIMNCMKTIASLNTPLAMFIVGVYLAQTDIRHMFQRKSLYLVSIVRLIVIPVVSLLFLLLLPREYKDMKIVLLLASACPVGANVSMYAQLHQKDYSYAVETVTISTIYSIITMPLFLLAAQHLL